MAIAVTACSNTGTPVPVVNHGTVSGGAAIPGTASFLHSDSSSVMFLQWPVDGSGFVSGTVKQDYVTGSAGSQTVRDDTGGFTGQINRDSVTINFTGSWGAVYGTESASSLTLNVPQQGGGLQATLFQAATPNDYNAALAALQGTVSQSNQQAQQLQQEASQAQAQSNAQQALNSDLAGLGADENKAANAVAAIPAAEKAVSTASTTADGKLAAEKAYTGPQADCYQLSSMAYNTNSAVYDLNSAVYNLTSTTNIVDNSISSLNGDISQAQKDEQTVQAVGGNAPTDAGSQIDAAAKALADEQASERQAQTYGDNATKHGEDVSTTAGSLTTNCNNGG
ncbi:MAG TPA: hypothetical protein VGL06_08650 [Pseudonocardiaceae bacterium]